MNKKVIACQLKRNNSGYKTALHPRRILIWLSFQFVFRSELLRFNLT